MGAQHLWPKRGAGGKSRGKAAVAGALFPHDHDPEEQLAQAQSLFPAAECGFDGKRITLHYEENEE